MVTFFNPNELAFNLSNKGAWYVRQKRPGKTETTDREHRHKRRWGWRCEKVKNEDLWAQYDNFTKDLSDNARKLAFAAAAVCWFFKTSENSFPPEVLWALRFVVLFFIFDILQYFLGALSVKFWTEYHENKEHRETGSIEGEYLKPKWVDYPSFSMWLLKVLALLASYLFLGKFIFP